MSVGHHPPPPDWLERFPSPPPRSARSTTRGQRQGENPPPAGHTRPRPPARKPVTLRIPPRTPVRARCHRTRFPSLSQVDSRWSGSWGSARPARPPMVGHPAPRLQELGRCGLPPTDGSPALRGSGGAIAPRTSRRGEGRGFRSLVGFAGLPPCDGRFPQRPRPGSRGILSSRRKRWRQCFRSASRKGPVPPGKLQAFPFGGCGWRRVDAQFPCSRPLPGPVSIRWGGHHSDLPLRTPPT